MKISYNWLKEFLDIQHSPEELGKILTDTGLEVEGIERKETVPGGLEGIVVGQVITCEPHTNADKLRVTTVNIGSENLLPIVCGAPNVAAGQKVLVATVGCTLYPTEGESFQIKKAKIRGEVSEGMICAEDEIGLGASHDGILVLPENTPIGLPAAKYFNLESDYCIEIGLTPNRTDAMSHLGVARDIAAVLGLTVKKPMQVSFNKNSGESPISVKIESDLCFEYHGLALKNVTIKPSPDYVQQKLKCIGLNPINNVVDITNLVMHELGQPLHAFDADKIAGNQVIVRTANAGETITCLDKISRNLSDEHLVVANENEAMAIAGVMGGEAHSITLETKNIFLESARFDAGSVRKTSKNFGLKTDSSFRFERGTDPAMPLEALRRAAALILQHTGGTVVGNEVSVLNKTFEPITLNLLFANFDKIIGKKIDRERIRQILLSLDFDITYDYLEGFTVTVPGYRVDVTREIDVIEEVLRIYGFNNVNAGNKIQYQSGYPLRGEKHNLLERIANHLSARGFNEILCNTLSNKAYLDFLKDVDFEPVSVMNPLSEQLSMLRNHLLFGGLESIQRNLARKRGNLQLFEFGKTYRKEGEKNKENEQLALWITGDNQPENWESGKRSINFYNLSAQINSLLDRVLGTNITLNPIQNPLGSLSAEIKSGNKVIGNVFLVRNSILSSFDIKQEVYYAEINVATLLQLHAKQKHHYEELAKYPEVRRDLALLLDKTVSYNTLKELAFKAEQKLLIAVNAFDVYEGDKIPEGKKSYAISFTFRDRERTLTDQQIEAIMQKLISTFEQNLKAEVRK